MKTGKLAVLLAAVASGKIALSGTNDFYVTGYASFDVSSGYVLFGARENDEPCYWTYGELNAGYGKLGSLGVMFWQNTDMTTQRKAAMQRMNEWDFAAFARTGYEIADGWRINLEIGHLWYIYHGVTANYKPYYHTMEEWGGRIALENPYVTPYFEYHHDYKVYDGTFMLGGLKHQFELPLGFSFTADLTLGGGDRNYNECMYPPFDGSISGCIAYVQLMGTLRYWFNDYFGVHLNVAYVSIVDGDIRDAMDKYGSPYANDYVWGTIGVDFAF